MIYAEPLSELDPVRINTSISLLAPLPVWCDLTRLWGRLTNIECSDRAVVKYVMVLDLETRMEHGKLLIRVLQRGWGLLMRSPHHAGGRYRNVSLLGCCHQPVLSAWKEKKTRSLKLS